MKKIGVVFLSVLFIFAPIVLAEERQDFEDWMDYRAAFGIVKVISVDGKTMTLEDQSANDINGVKPLVRFNIIENAETKGVDSPYGIKEGDSVSIEYYTTPDGRKIVDYIAVEERTEEEEMDILLEDI